MLRNLVHEDKLFDNNTIHEIILPMTKSEMRPIDARRRLRTLLTEAAGMQNESPSVHVLHRGEGSAKPVGISLYEEKGMTTIENIGLFDRHVSVTVQNAAGATDTYTTRRHGRRRSGDPLTAAVFNQAVESTRMYLVEDNIAGTPTEKDK